MQYQFEQFRFDTSDGLLENTESGASLTLRPQVARLLAVFLDHPDTVIDRETLYREVWGESTVVDFESGLAALVRELRQSLDQAGGKASLVETVPRRGFRFRMSLPRRRNRPVAVIAAAAASLLLIVVSAWWFHEPPATPAESPSTLSMAILPFDQYGDPERTPAHAHLLLADALLARLGERELAQLELIGRASMRPYADRKDVATAVAEDLGVDLLMEGTLLADEDGWSVSVRLLQIPPGRILWSQSLDWPGYERLPITDTAGRLSEQFAQAWPELFPEAVSTKISE